MHSRLSDAGHGSELYSAVLPRTRDRVTVCALRSLVVSCSLANVRATGIRFSVQPFMQAVVAAKNSILPMKPYRLYLQWLQCFVLKVPAQSLCRFSKDSSW